MNRRKYIISTDTTSFIFFLLLPHFKLTIFDFIPTMDLIFNMGRVVSVLIMLTVYIRNILIKKSIIKTQSIVLGLILLYYLEIFISTVLNGVNLKAIVLRVISQLAVFMICSFYAYYNGKNLVKALFALGEIIVYSNLISILIYPNGMYNDLIYSKNWILGYKNNFMQFYLGFCVVSALFLFYFKKYIRPILLLIAMIVSVILADSSTSIIVMILYSAMLIVSVFDKGNRINSLVLTIGNIIAFFVVVIYRAMDYFQLLIVQILHKTNTLSSRTMLWDDVYYLIRKKPIMGYGFRGREAIYLFGRSWATNAHNAILQALIEGGVICLGLYLLINFVLLKELYLYRHSFSAKTLSVGMFVFNIAMLTEVYNAATVYVLFGLAASVGAMFAIEKNDRMLAGLLEK